MSVQALKGYRYGKNYGRIRKTIGKKEILYRLKQRAQAAKVKAEPVKVQEKKAATNIFAHCLDGAPAELKYVQQSKPHSLWGKIRRFGRKYLNPNSDFLKIATALFAFAALGWLWHESGKINSPVESSGYGSGASPSEIINNVDTTNMVVYDATNETAVTPQVVKSDIQTSSMAQKQVKTQNKQSVNRAGGTSYVVQANENLWKIARNALKQAGTKNPSNGMIQTYVNRIVEMNKLSNPDLIYTGDTLQLPHLNVNA